MDREEIIRMARQAGLDPDLWNYTDAFERFAALVAKHEREKLAAWMMRQGYATGHGDTTEDLLRELNWQIEERIRIEREACAKLCEETTASWTQDLYNRGCMDCAAAIRARGDK